jgi:hypothetical protein
MVQVQGLTEDGEGLEGEGIKWQASQGGGSGRFGLRGGVAAACLGRQQAVRLAVY